METTEEIKNVSNDGLETLESSQEVTNLSDFLSLEELGISMDEKKESPIEIKEDEDNPAFEKNKKEESIKPVVEDIVVEPDSSDIKIEEDDEIPTIGGSSNYKQIVDELVKEGLIDNNFVFETEDGEVSLEDIDVDKDVFLTLLKHNQDSLKKKLTENTVEIDGVSDFTKKLISIEKHGGNVSSALKAYQTIKEPLSDLDLSDVRGQRAVCFLRLQQQGIQGDEARDLIETYELKGVLEDKAIQYKEQLDTAFEAWMQKQEEEAIAKDKEYKESLKEYRTSLNETLKSFNDFNLSETHRRKLLDIATKQNEDGIFELDNLIDEKVKNPVEVADLLLFLTDKDKYIEVKSKEKLDQERKKVMSRINIIPKSRNTDVDLKSNKRVSNKDIIPLEKLNIKI